MNVLMLLSNAYDPDPRVRQEALALLSNGHRVHLLAWDRDLKSPAYESMEGVEVERVFLPSRHGRGTTTATPGSAFMNGPRTSRRRSCRTSAPCCPNWSCPTC